MAHLCKLSFISSLLTLSTMAFAGTMGPAEMLGKAAINPGFIGGIEGGVSHVDWPSAGGSQFIATTNNVLTAQENSQHAFPGTVGVFVGYKFPIKPFFALEPMVAYHYVGTSGLNVTNNFTANTAGGLFPSTGTSITPQYIKVNAELNLVDFTVQANYRLDNGVNFFAQPGFAVSINQYQYSDSYINNLNLSENNVSFRPEIAVGVGKMLSERINLFAKYNYIVGNDLNSIYGTLTPNVSMVMLGLSLEA